MAKDKICRPFVGIIAPENKFTVDTIDDLKSRNYLTIGDIVDLNGYYTAGDGAHHKRKIESADDGSGVQLANGLWANIVHNGTVEAGWFGGISNSTTDYKNAEIQKSLNYFRDYNGDLIITFEKLHYVNASISCVWNKSDGYKKQLKGAIKGEFDAPSEVFFKFGIEAASYGSISNKHINGVFSVSKDCKAVLKLYTQGRSDLAFWNSKFNLQLTCRRGYGLWVANGFFENEINSLRVNLMRKYQETESLQIGDESIGYVLSNETGENIVSSVKHCFLNIWGGKHSVLTTSFSGKYAPDINIDEAHIFDTTHDGLKLNNQGTSGCFLNLLHAEFIGRPDGADHYGCFWNGSGTINKIEGGGGEDNCGMVGFLRVYNQTSTPFVCNSSGKPYGMPNKKHLVMFDGRNGAKGFFKGYYFKLDNTGDVVFNQYSTSEIETDRYVAWVKAGSGVYKLIDKQTNTYVENESVLDRLTGKRLSKGGISNVYTTVQNYESYVSDGHLLNFGTTSNSSGIYNRFSFFNQPLIERGKLTAYSTDVGVRVLANFLKDAGLVASLEGTAFVTTYSIEQLDTPYYTLKMQQENVYEDFVSYMDSKLEYDKEQRYLEEQRQLAFESREDQEQTYEEWLATQPVLIPDNEPQPSEKLLEFKNKYVM